MPTIPIYSDVLSKDSLRRAIEEKGAGQVQLVTLDNPETFRSPLTDPTILGAIIQTGGTVIATLLSVFLAHHLSRKKDEQTEGEGMLIIRLQPGSKLAIQREANEVIIRLDGLDEDNPTNGLELDQLEGSPEEIVDISYTEEL